MTVCAVTPENVEPTVQALVGAFATDPLIGFLFKESREREAHVGEFFRILLLVRVALGMPALCVGTNGQVLGGVMGYDTTRPTWEPSHMARWNRLMETAPALQNRLAEYEALADRFMPSLPHYYLGVIGVRPEGQGRGLGGQLLTAFCDMSVADPSSAGVYLETASEASLRFYLRNGFEVRGEGTLGQRAPLWCVFRPATTATPADV